MTCIYLLQPSELSGTNRFKVGMSTNYVSRVKSYGAGVRVLGFFECRKIREVEKTLIEELNKNDNIRVIKGKEYFEGPESEIFNVFIDVMNKYRLEKNDEEEVKLVLEELLEKVEENIRKEQLDPMEEIRRELRKEVETEIREELREEIRKEVEAEIREENIRRELREEIRREVEAEIREENIRKEVEEEKDSNKKNNEVKKLLKCFQNKDFKCCICNYSARDNYDLEKHLNTKKHIQNILDNNACEYCFKSYSNLGNRNRHMYSCVFKPY